MATTTETTKRIAPGIVKVYRRGAFVGFRASVRVADPSRPHGRLRPKRFAKDATLTEMKDWRDRTRLVAKLTPTAQPPITTLTGFAADARTYLETVRAMPSIADRRLHMQDWMLVFGERPRQGEGAITSAEIRAQRDRWLTKGPKREYRKTPAGWKWVFTDHPLAPGSVNRRLRALENLYTVLDGRSAPNPVREVPEADEPAPSARGTTFAVIQEILDHMPERTRGLKGVQGSRCGESKTRARLAVIMWTGLAHSQLAKLTPADVDVETLTYYRPRRKKGRRGSRNRAPHADRPTPLLPQAAAALQHFFAIGAAGRFSTASIGRSFKRAIRAANRARRAAGVRERIPETLRPYDVKHTFASEAYRASKDLRAVQELLGLSQIELADRYAQTAVAPAAAEAAARLAVAAGERSPQKVTTPQKARRSR